MAWLVGAKVQIYKEEVLFAEGYTDEKGYFSTKIPQGRYRFLITYDEKLRLEWYQDIAQETKFAVKLQKYLEAVTPPVEAKTLIFIQTLKKVPLTVKPITKVVSLRFPSIRVFPLTMIQTFMKIPVLVEVIT